MKILLRIVLPALIIVSLSGCGLLPYLYFLWINDGFGGVQLEQINFVTDSRILRGRWTGEFTKDSIEFFNGQLDLQAEYLDNVQYRVRGAFVFEGITYGLNGVVKSHGGEEFVQAQAVPSGGFYADLLDTSGNTVGTLTTFGFYDQGQKHYMGQLFLDDGIQQDAYSFFIQHL